MSADYEMPLATTTDDQGRQLRVVKHFSDGIIVVDPVKCVIYDPDNKIIGETPYGRDVIVNRAASGELRVYGIAFVDRFLHRGWILRNRTLAPMSPLWGHWQALCASICGHWFGYGISILSCVLAMASLLSSLRESESWNLGLIPWEISAAAIWLMLNSMYGRLLAPLTLMLSLVVSLPLAINRDEVMLAVFVLGGAAFLLRLLFACMLGLFRLQESSSPETVRKVRQVGSTRQDAPL
jgi:hypothetical protein